MGQETEEAEGEGPTLDVGLALVVEEVAEEVGEGGEEGGGGEGTDGRGGGGNRGGVRCRKVSSASDRILPSPRASSSTPPLSLSPSLPESA